MPDLKYISVAEFRALGFIQEINRRLLHPAGLALSVVVEEDGTEHFGEIWDCRDDPEGIYFDGDYSELASSAASVDALILTKRETRCAALGYMVQPITAPAAGRGDVTIDSADASM